MIPLEQKREVASMGIEGSASFEISGKDAAHIMTILRDTLYSDKILAVLREYASNAWDANRMAGRGDVPIEVSLPTYQDPTLRIKDHGPGLSLEDVFEVYNKYGASTKRDSNTAVGMLGIGSKSGFAYSDSFTIVSRHGGQKATYVAVIDSSEKGKVDLFDVQELPCSCGGGEHVAVLAKPTCPRQETGVEIQIPIKPHDIAEFEKKARALFAFFEPQPKINTTLPPIPNGKDFPGLGRMLEIDPGQGYGYNQVNPRGQWTAIMGCVPYKVNLAQLKGLSNSAQNLSGIMWFDIGMLQVAASREELKYGDATKDALAQRINEIIDKYVEFLLEGVDKLSQWDRRIRIAKIKELYLPVPKQYQDLGNNWVNFDRTSDAVFKLKAKGWKGKIEGVNGFRVESKTRFVIRNERKVLNGYTYQDGDIIVDPVLDENAARREFKAQVVKHLIEGAPQVNISALPWSKPVSTAVRTPMDAARAKAVYLTLDPKNIHADKKSERWTPVTRVATDQDVYVVLESFAASGFADFYETYENDRLLIESVGGKMPLIIGYRNTQANPVSKAKLKGKDYRTWRDDDFIKLLLVQPGVKEAVEAKVWGSNISSYGVNARVLEEGLGLDHPVSEFALKVIKAREEFVKVKATMHPLMNRVDGALKVAPPKAEWEKLAKLYPLIHIHGPQDISWIGGTHSARWFDYIKMMDLQHKTESLVEQVRDFNVDVPRDADSYEGFEEDEEEAA